MRTGDARNLRKHRVHVGVRCADVPLNERPSEQWWFEFSNGPGRVMHMVELNGANITFVFQSDTEIAREVETIDSRIDWANRRLS